MSVARLDFAHAARRMNAAARVRRASDGRRGPALACGVLIGVVAAVLPTAGCVAFSFDRVQLGQTQPEYRPAFPEGQTRRTPVGLCYLERDPFGRTDAVVLLLAGDRRVAGKFHAVHVERRSPLAVETSYQLRGELNPGLARLTGTGPVDTLRAVTDELTTGDPDTFVREAQGWVAAGLVRLIQQWPHTGDAGPAATRVADLLERVPGQGTARVTVTPAGVLQFEYTHSVTR